jgi:hypothetical protein
MARVRCADCGFLAVRNSSSKTLHEAESYARETGHLLQYYEKGPVCFVGAFRLDDEMHGMDSAEFLRVISKERDCPRFYPWVQGFTPKEHQAMLRDETLLKWQEERREADRRWQQEQRDKDQQRQEQQRRRDRVWQIINIFLAASLAFLFGNLTFLVQ